MLGTVLKNANPGKGWKKSQRFGSFWTSFGGTPKRRVRIPRTGERFVWISSPPPLLLLPSTPSTPPPPLLLLLPSISSTPPSPPLLLSYSSPPSPPPHPPHLPTSSSSPSPHLLPLPISYPGERFAGPGNSHPSLRGSPSSCWRTNPHSHVVKRRQNLHFRPHTS